MTDYREELLNNTIDTLILSGNFAPDQVAQVQETLIANLSHYDLSQRTTAVATVDQSSENLLKLYLGSLATERYSNRTLKVYFSVLHRFYFYIGKSLLEATVFDLRFFIADTAKVTSPRTCENYRTYISSFYNWLCKEGFIGKNPMEKVNPIKYADIKEEPFTEVEIDKIRKACSNLREECEVLLLCSTGARVSEIADLDISDVNFVTREVRIRHGKGDKSRTTYMSDVCSDYLKRYLETRHDDSPYLLVNRLGNKMNHNTIGADIRKIGKRAGVDNVHCHRFRKTFASDMKRRGGDIAIIQRLLGHRSIDTTMRIYVNITDEAVRNEYATKA